MTWLWLTAQLRNRALRLLGVVAGVALTVALLAAIGGFIGAASATMTQRAASGVTVDWQVQVATGADVGAATRVVRSAPGVQAVEPVTYGRATGLTATTADGTQTTGAAVVLGVPADYAATFPGQVRQLAGATSGVRLAQQTAANLHVAPGDPVAVLIGGRRAVIRVEGVVDLPQANSLFQTVGAPAGAQPTAPPDNVVLVPQAIADRLFAGSAGLVSTQLHVRRSHALPPDPASAYVAVTSAANNLTAQLAGAGVIGDDLAAALDAARSDAAYANVLFLFLGLPGVVLGSVLTAAVALADRRTRGRERALLRIRGASHADVVRLAAAEGGIVAVLGVLLGLGVAQVVATTVFGGSGLVAGASVPWVAAAGLVGAALAVGSAVVPAAIESASTSVTASRGPGPQRSAWWERFGIDAVLLVVGVVLVLPSTQQGYAVVLAPEGVPTVAVDYWAFLGPAALWGGGALLAVRLVRMVLGRRRLLSAVVHPIAGGLAPVVAASIGRRRRSVARISAFLAVVVAFAVSTSVFNATYRQQAEVDARLTNGADVRVTLPATTPPSTGATVARNGGVRSAEPIRHRYAYVGADLQDLFGVNAATVRSATSLQDAYFAGGTAAQVLARLAATPDGVLVSQETARDYRLTIGDRITLRVPAPGSATPKPIRFTYVGQALEFPTAPRDSFLVVNSGYLASSTGDPSVNTYLVTTDGTPPSAVATSLRRTLGTSAAVTPIGVSRSTIGSSLTSIDLSGLTAVELVFALLLAIAVAGVVLLLGFTERRTTFAVLGVLGAGPAQRRALPVAEGAVVLLAGLILGGMLGFTIAEVLSSVLAGVFDPPPAALAIPAGYLAATAGVVLAAGAAASVVAARRSARPPVEALRAG